MTIDNLDEFKQHYSLSAKLIDEMSKEQLAEVTRICLRYTLPIIKPDSVISLDLISC